MALYLCNLSNKEFDRINSSSSERKTVELSYRCCIEILLVSAKDIFHETVKRALQKEQWTITDDPLRFKFGNVNFQVDLGAEHLVAAERSGEKIAIEIKSFLNPSAITDFYSALGQFLSYRLALESVEPNRTLYLAVPVDVYQTFFQYEFTQTAVQRYQVLIIVYDPASEVIVQWIN
jgi:XisH protein